MIVGYAVETERCHNGSVDFDALTRQHKDAVYRQMIRVCGNREDAEDVLIEALLKAYRHLDQLRESDSFSCLARADRETCLLAIEGARIVAPALAAFDVRGRRSRASRNGAPSRCTTGPATDEATAKRRH